MNKVFFLILSAFILFAFSCAQPSADNADSLTVSMKQADLSVASEPVQLYRGQSYVHRKYGMFQIDRRYDVLVQNLSYVKKVMIHHKMVNGTWADLTCDFSKTVNNGLEMWSFTHNVVNQYVLGDQFVVKYVANGVTYWDNNNGQNYTLHDTDGVVLGKNFNVLAGGSGSGYDIRNIGFQKKVEIVYSMDNWKTVKVAQAQFTSGYTYGYSYTVSPNSIGIEKWQLDWSNPLEQGPKHYAIAYTVNGVTYWDNNFGANYYSPN